jgi:hypothetical protein
MKTQHGNEYYAAPTARPEASTSRMEKSPKGRALAPSRQRQNLRLQSYIGDGKFSV